jgi:hypothetical protein
VSEREMERATKPMPPTHIVAARHLAPHASANGCSDKSVTHQCGGSSRPTPTPTPKSSPLASRPMQDAACYGYVQIDTNERERKMMQVRCVALGLGWVGFGFDRFLCFAWAISVLWFGFGHTPPILAASTPLSRGASSILSFLSPGSSSRSHRDPPRGPWSAPNEVRYRL